MKLWPFVCLLLVAIGSAPAADRAAIYRADIDFFLDQFEEKAGHFFERKEIDWDEVRKWSLAELENVENDADHLRLCARLVARLKDGHARLRDCRVEWPDESEGRKWRYPKIGMVLQEDEALVILTDPSLKIPIGSKVIGIDGVPAREWIEAKADEWSDRRGYSTRRHALTQVAAMGLGGWEGTTFEIEFERPDGTRGEGTVDRSLGEQSPVRLDLSKQLGDLKMTGRNKHGFTKKGNGYIRLRDIPNDLPDYLDQILPEFTEAPGMILDMRGNRGGGCDHYAVFARFLEKGEFWGRIEGVGTAPYPGPLVVIVDAMTASAGETTSGQFAEDQRALMIGPEGSAGMSSSKTTIKAPSGLCSAYFSVRSNKGRFNRGHGIEGIGVIPHEIVPYEAEDLAAGIDSQIRRAEELLKIGKWPEHIDYEPPEGWPKPKGE